MQNGEPLSWTLSTQRPILGSEGFGERIMNLGSDGDE
jgi:hypothetical protein